jgi:hypothetical protein
VNGYPPQEGSHFSFFLYLNGWEPRVRSKSPIQLGAWHHLQAGWDGREIWLDVDGQRTNVRRSGEMATTPAYEQLELGQYAGMLDELRIENGSPVNTCVAQWLFDGDLRDSTGQSHDLTGVQPQFTRDGSAEAWSSTGGPARAASSPDLQLAPGLRIDCSVRFDQLPDRTRHIVFKDGEYQLRLNGPDEGGCFAFFVNLDGWEPRICSEQPAVAGQWYRLIACWDGSVLTLDVNGQRKRVTRSGMATATDNPVMVGGHGGLLDNLSIENPRQPTLLVRSTRQEHAILQAGRVERLTTSIRNIGKDAANATCEIKLTPGVQCLDPLSRNLGPLPSGAEQSLEWRVQADSPVIGWAALDLKAGTATSIAVHPLVFFTSDEQPLVSSLSTKSSDVDSDPNTQTLYVDSIAGDNARAGTSPETAWKDFSNVNGRVLGPGERLLLRRGSVFNQELKITARGTAERWAEIATYGEGTRPIIRRNWDIDDRCALVSNPDYLHVHGLVVSHAAKGLIVAYTEPGHRGLLIEDCIAHHIEGLYRFNAHGIPEWRDRQGPTGDELSMSAGIGVTGAQGRDLVLRDCEMFQCSSGYFVTGEDVVIDRVFCHDNIVHNTSPHPFIVAVRRTVLQNSICDAAGWHASAGTMGIMLGNPQGFIIRNCYFRNQPDSGSHDEGGVDFENSGNGCLIDHCTFENNAGAAIEMLGLQTPQTTNVEIRNSRFIQNNTANKLGPSEIFIWGGIQDPTICCSTGTVQGNGYVTLPGVEFFINQAPKLTSWTLADNRSFASVEELERAMPFNRPPSVDAGKDVWTTQQTFSLAGTVHDDGQPGNAPLATRWELLEGPGPVAFTDSGNLTTEVTMSQPGDYILRLVADDGELWFSDTLAVHVLPPDYAVAAAWEFNTNLDKEGWTEEELGTRVMQYPNQDWPTTAHPVKQVAGGQFVMAIENSSAARLTSPDALGFDLTGDNIVSLRFQNHTPATTMRLRFTTEAESNWDDGKSVVFPVTANDNGFSTYTLDAAKIPNWKGRLKQLRLEMAAGQPLTGTVRIDYIWIGNP